MCDLKDFQNLKLDPLHKIYLDTELPIWHKSYLSPKVKGGTVLDLGAGCGETALFYQKHGADRIICLEPNKECLKLFKENFPEAFVVPESAKLVLIEGRMDYGKIDVELGEEYLTVESHFPVRWKKPNPVIWRMERETRPVLTALRSWNENGMTPTDRFLALFHHFKVTVAHWIRLYVLGPRKC